MNSNYKLNNIYISHIALDKEIADILADFLKYLTIGRVGVKTSGILSEAGEADWIELARKYIIQTELLLLILPNNSVIIDDKTREFDWTLFETAMFLSNASDRELIIIHHPQLDLPMRFKSFRKVPADTQNIKEFFGELIRGYISSNIPPLIPDASDKLIHDETAKFAIRFCDAFPSDPERRIRMLTTSFVLDIDRDKARGGIIPEDAMITANAESWRMLGLLEGRTWKWGELMPFLHAETGWIEELALAIQNAANERVPRPIHRKFEAEDGKVYVPVLYRDEYIPPRTYRVNVVFVPTEDKPIDSNLLFVIMSYRDDMESVFKEITNAAAAKGLTAQRVKDDLGDYRITDRIIDMIKKAKFIVADLTYERPNVYFELGYARALGKTVLTTAKQDTDIHFDVKDWPYIPYEDEAQLNSELSTRLDKELGNK